MNSPLSPQVIGLHAGLDRHERVQGCHALGVAALNAAHPTRARHDPYMLWQLPRLLSSVGGQLTSPFHLTPTTGVPAGKERHAPPAFHHDPAARPPGDLTP